jgi:hypothetical protein
MDQGEVSLAFTPEMKTASIVPIMRDGVHLGFLDIMETRDPDRKTLDASDRFIVRVVAEHIARLWAPDAGGWRARTNSDEAALTTTLREFHRDIVNPITSIIGSVELIRHKQPELNAASRKYLSTIEGSASRIQESTARFYGNLNPRDRRETGAHLVYRDALSLVRTEHLRPSLASFARPASMSTVESDTDMNMEDLIEAGAGKSTDDPRRSVRTADV